MKRVINGKVYNTETATEICDTGSNGGISQSDFNYEDSYLYVTKKGNFFIAGEGGAMSRFSSSCGQNSYCGGEGIVVVSREEALELAERAEMDPDEIAEYFTIVEA